MSNKPDIRLASDIRHTKAAFDLRSAKRRVWIRWGQKVDIFDGASAKGYNSVYDNIRWEDWEGTGTPKWTRNLRENQRKAAASGPLLSSRDSTSKRTAGIP